MELIAGRVGPGGKERIVTGIGLLPHKSRRFAPGTLFGFRGPGFPDVFRCLRSLSTGWEQKQLHTVPG